MRRITVGSRGSDLAVAQCRQIMAALATFNPDLHIEHRIVTTVGDADQRSLPEIGGQGVFTKELENELLAGTVDLAVHSLKDLPSTLADGLILGAVPPRESPHELLCGSTLKGLAEGARIGTGAPRRQAQLRALRKDLQFEEIRGNVPTRLARVEPDSDKPVDAIVLAEAGLRRLGLRPRIGERLSLASFPPAAGQAALGLEIRAEDDQLRQWMRPIHHGSTAACITAERSLLRALQAGCRTPIGTLASQEPGPLLTLRAQVSSLDGETVLKHAMQGHPREAADLGKRLGDVLLAQGAEELLKAVE